MPNNIDIRGKQEAGGYYMEYPPYSEAIYFSRSLKYDERFTVLSQGFHRGAAPVECYSLEEFVFAMGKREFDNPTGGVRDVDLEKLIHWISDVIGDKTLGNAISRIRDNCRLRAEAIDTMRVIVFIRLNQYKEVLEEQETSAC